MPTYTIGIGSTVRIGRMTGNTVTYTAMVGVQDVTLPESTAAEVDVTAMDSPNRTTQTIAGLTTNEDVSLDMIWLPGSPTDTLLTSIRASGEIVKIEFSVPGMVAPEVYNGWLKGYSRSAPVAERLEATATFKINEKTVA